MRLRTSPQNPKPWWKDLIPLAVLILIALMIQIRACTTRESDVNAGSDSPTGKSARTVFEVIQTEADLGECRRLEMEVLAALDARSAGPNPNGHEDPRRYFKGYRGEFAVRDWLESESWLVWRHRVNANGLSQRSEFEIKFGGAWNLTEVKCAGEAYHQRCEWQASDPMAFKILIAVHLPGGPDDPRAVVMGWLGRKDCEIASVYDGRRRWPLDRLRPMHRLPQVILRQQTHAEWLESYDRNPD